VGETVGERRWRRQMWALQNMTMKSIGISVSLGGMLTKLDRKDEALQKPHSDDFHYLDVNFEGEECFESSTHSI
jgi:hypothetical protein